MAVNGELLVYPGQELTPQDFAIMMERISVIRSGILSGCTIAFSETESNQLNVEGGYVFVKGRLLKVEAGTLDTSNLSASAASWFVYAKVHLAEVEPADIVTIFVTETAATDEGDLNSDAGGTAYATLATIKVSDKTVHQSFTPEIGAVESVLLEASKWVAETETATGNKMNTYKLYDPRFSTSAHIEIVPRTIGYDYGYLKTLQLANIHPFSISEGVLTLGSYGVKPAVDLEIGIIFRGNL